MVNTLFPTGTAAAPVTYQARQLRQTTAPLLAGATPARPFGARSGVRPGTSSALVSATSSTWSCGAHAGVLDVQVASEAGPYTYAVDAATSGAVTAADASNPRMDIVYVQLNDPTEQADGSTAGVTVRYLAGSPNAVPVNGVPATPVRSIVLARINVPRSGTGSPTVTWIAPYSASAGGVVDYASKALLLADSPPLGIVGRDIETGSMYARHPGSTPFWLHIGGAPDQGAWTAQGIYVPSDASRPVRAYAHDGRNFVEGSIGSTISATFVAGEEYAMGKFPDAFGIKVARNFFVDNNATRMTVRVYPDGTISFRPTATFSGVLNLSLDGLTWVDKRLP